MATLLPILFITGTVSGLNLTCPVCHKTWRNIPAVGHCVSYDEFPALHIKLEGIDPEAVCLCLIEHLTANPVVILWSSNMAAFN